MNNKIPFTGYDIPESIKNQMDKVIEYNLEDRPYTKADEDRYNSYIILKKKDKKDRWLILPWLKYEAIFEDGDLIDIEQSEIKRI